jgi:hypothetical protein
MPNPNLNTPTSQPKGPSNTFQCSHPQSHMTAPEAGLLSYQKSVFLDFDRQILAYWGIVVMLVGKMILKG